MDNKSKVEHQSKEFFADAFSDVTCDIETANRYSRGSDSGSLYKEKTIILKPLLASSIIVSTNFW